MLDSAELVAFVACRDLEASHRFYGGVLGLRRVHASPAANVYDVAGRQLRVTEAAEPVSAPYTVLGWNVEDIEATVRELADAGVELRRYDGFDQDEHAIWTTPGGTRVAWFADPDGNVLSVQQLGDDEQAVG
ncbi:VOC family protein [Gordonia araii]|nr:VOC family protein [Gordonia araii]NNG98113.1 VOC family protein [Gordonia araii NBRC 100433]